MGDESEEFDLKVAQVVRSQEMSQSRSKVMGLTNPAQGITTYQVNRRNYDSISKYDQIPYDEIIPNIRLIGNIGGQEKSGNGAKQ